MSFFTPKQLRKGNNWTYPAILLIVIPFLTGACSTKKDETIPNEIFKITIDPLNIPTPSDLSDVVQSVRLIPLDTDSSCYIEDVYMAFVGEEYIVIVTRGSSHDLFLFSIDGKFIRRISRQGKGPGEYIHIQGFSVLEESSMIYINPNLNGSLIAYSMNGDFVETIKGIDGSGTAIKLNQNETAYSLYSDFYFKIVNTLSNDTNAFVKKLAESEWFDYSYSGTKHTGYFYSAWGQDTVWRVESDTVRPQVVLDFGSGLISHKEFKASMSASGKMPVGKIAYEGGDDIWRRLLLFLFYL